MLVDDMLSADVTFQTVNFLLQLVDNTLSLGGAVLSLCKSTLYTLQSTGQHYIHFNLQVNIIYIITYSYGDWSKKYHYIND